MHFDYPEGLAPYVEAISVSGDFTLFPLGLTCTYDNRKTAAAPVTIAHPRWDSTAIASVASIGFLGGVVTAIRTQRPSPFEELPSPDEAEQLRRS